MRDQRDPGTNELVLPHRRARPKAGQPLRLGYARVSTDDQQLALQRDALTKAKCWTVYEDTASGKDTQRPELEQCMKALRAGDTLVVWRLDRLGRSLPDLVQIVEGLEQAGIGFESLTEHIDTASAAGKLTFHLFAALAQFERNLIRERTMAGLQAARARGRKGGRRKVLTAKHVREIQQLLAGENITVQDVAERYGVGRATIFRYLRSAKADSHTKEK